LVRGGGGGGWRGVWGGGGGTVIDEPQALGFATWEASSACEVGVGAADDCLPVGVAKGDHAGRITKSHEVLGIASDVSIPTWI